MEHENNLSNYNSNDSSSSKNKENKRNEKGIDGGGLYGGVPVHNQVTKIKKEMEKFKLEQPEKWRINLLRVFSRQQSSPSPLGLAASPISVGNA